ncbi:MAG: hypothetical protein ACE5FU_12505 [Nitrospinota bacterium]
MKKAFAAGVLLFLIVLFGLQYLISGVFLLKGATVQHSLEMGDHGSRLFFANMKNLPFLFREFFGKPVYQRHKISPFFFGLNVAPPRDPDDDKKVISDLKSLNVKALRIDVGFGYSLPLARINSFIESVLPHFDVLLHVVQHPDMAAAMSTRAYHEQWQEFLRALMSRYQGRVKGIEIGSLPNRKKWSGYSIVDYLEAVKIAFTLSDGYGVEIAGPNIQDFEPFWQITFFEELKKEGLRFSVSTDNLFVDRAVQPELFDTHVLGKKLTNLAKMDLINKSRVLASISKEFGVDSLYSTYTQWNLNVPSSYYFASEERLALPESYANYLVRYYLLAAAGGYIDRVYWGEYASYKEGLLDDGYNPVEEERAFPDAHHKFLGFGDVDSHKKRSAFFAYKTMAKLLEGSVFVEKVKTREGLFLFRFDKGKSKIFTIWTLDGEELSFESDDFFQCIRFDRDGKPLSKPKEQSFKVSASPQYLVCD